MLERLPGVVRAHIEVTIRVARDLCGTHLAELGVHRVARGLGRSDEINLITLDDPAGDVAGIVGLELLGRKRLDSTHERLVHADRRAYEVIIEEVGKLSRGRLPAHVLDLARLHPATGVAVALGCIVIMTGFGSPRGIDLSVKGPVRQIHTLDGVGERAALKCVGCKPQLAVPGANAVAGLVLRNPERQQALRSE